MKIETNKSYSNFLLVNFDKVKIMAKKEYNFDLSKPKKCLIIGDEP